MKMQKFGKKVLNETPKANSIKCYQKRHGVGRENIFGRKK
jgi:hypothetical protein